MNLNSLISIDNFSSNTILIYKRNSRFSTQKKAEKAYNEYMNNYSKSAVKLNITMSYKEFFEKYFKPDYKRAVKISTYENRISSSLM